MLSQPTIRFAITCSQKLSLTWSSPALSKIQLRLRYAAGPNNALIIMDLFDWIIALHVNTRRDTDRAGNSIDHFEYGFQWHYCAMQQRNGEVGQVQMSVRVGVIYVYSLAWPCV